MKRLAFQMRRRQQPRAREGRRSGTIPALGWPAGGNFTAVAPSCRSSWSAGAMPISHNRRSPRAGAISVMPVGRPALVNPPGRADA